MGRVLLAGAMVVASIGSASAGPTRKVSVETDPPGATVYLNDPADGPVCEATPCTFDAPIGQTPIILRLQNYGPLVEALDVPKKGKPITVKYKLTMALATLVIEAPSAKGASIRIDEEDKGKVPARVEVSGNDAHHVVVALGGKTLYDDFVNVGIGEELAITPKSASTVVATKEPDPIVSDDPGGGSGSGSGGGSAEPAIEKTAPEGPRNQLLKISGMFYYGARTFSYTKGTTPSGNIRDVINDYNSMFGLELEIWPLANATHLAGLSLLAHYARSVIPQPVMGSNLKSAWDTLEVTLRHRWTPGDVLALELGGGFVRDRFGFDGDPAEVATTPDITYGSIRIGGRVALRFGSFQPYLSAENRIVVSRGAFGDRFKQGTMKSASTVDGYGAALGVTAKLGPLDARIEGSILRYGWKFLYDPTSTYRADSGTDTAAVVSGTLGIAY